MIPRRYYNIVFAALMSGMMSLCISALLTFVIGGGENYWSRLLSAFPLSFAVALPVGILIMPVARSVAERLVEPE